MALQAILTQPFWNQMFSAYRPIEYVVQGDANQWVYCDIYIGGSGGTYYKTLMTNVRHNNGPGPTWLYYFDIQDAIQEFLNWHLQMAPNLFGVSIPGQISFAQVQCRFRGSSQDPYGIITPDGPIPVQATADTPAIPGGGTLWATGCVVVDAALQHEERFELSSHLQTHKILQFRFPTGVYGFINNVYGIYPLSHTKRMKVTLDDWGHWPGYVTELGYNGIPIHFAKLYAICYCEFGNGFVIQNHDLGYQFAVNHVETFAIPYAPRAISALPGGGAIPWNLVKQYYVYMTLVAGPQAGERVFSTPLLQLTRCVRRYRFWWRNYLGHFEQINFEDFAEITEVKSSRTEKPLVGPINQKRKYGNQRVNVHSNEVIYVRDYFEEDEMPRISEFLSSNRVYKETSRAETEYYQATDFLPVIIRDSKIDRIKMEDRWYYEVVLEIELANDNIIPRN